MGRAGDVKEGLSGGVMYGSAARRALSSATFVACWVCSGMERSLGEGAGAGGHELGLGGGARSLPLLELGIAGEFRSTHACFYTFRGPLGSFLSSPLVPMNLQLVHSLSIE
jgi:hypothetical protein